MTAFALRLTTLKLISAIAIVLPLWACGGGSDADIVANAGPGVTAPLTSIAPGASAVVPDSNHAPMVNPPVAAPAPNPPSANTNHAVNATDPGRPVPPVVPVAPSNPPPLVTAPTPSPSAPPPQNDQVAQPPVVPPAPPQAPQSDPVSHVAEIGINLPQLSYWDQSFAMADVMRQSSLVDTDWGANYAPDMNGAPGRDFNLLYNATTIGAGTYKLQFTGRADLSSSPIANQSYDAATNRTTADVVLPEDKTGNSWISFRNTRRSAASSSNDGVTDIHLWRPGYPTDGSVMFTTEFLAAMQKVQVLRSMDTVSTNDNDSVNWSDRPRPDFVGRNKRGQSWEWFVALANAADRDIWLNVPVKASDDYITKLAQLLRYGSDGNQPYTSTQANPVYPPLKPGIKVYLEYGNEIWNFAGGFYNMGWVKGLSDAVRLNPSHPIALDGPVTDEWLAFRRYIAWRSSFISKTFRSVWGDADMMVRIRPILAVQAGNANNYLKDGLMWAEAYYKRSDLSGIWWGGGGAQYYAGAKGVDINNPGAVQAYFDAPLDAQATRIDTTWTKAYGLRNIAYEGGPEPGVYGDYAGVKRDVIANTLNTDARMAGLMGRAYDLWRANGGDLFMYYNYTSMGAPWRFVDETRKPTVSDTGSVKMRFLDSLATRPAAALTLGGAVPGTVALRDAAVGVVHRGDSSGSWANNGAWLLRENGTTAHNEFILVPVRAAQAGQYALSVVTLAQNEQPTLEVVVNGKSVGMVTQPAVAAGTAVTSSAVSVTLPEGISVVRIRIHAGSEVWLRDLVLATAGG